MIGMHSRAKSIHLWLQDGSNDVGIVAICGMGGIGKTTIAKFVYNLNFSRFDASSFLANVRENSKQQDGMLRLQKQLLSDISKGRKEKIYTIDEGIVKIKEAICCKRVLLVLDDVDKMEQLDAVFGMRDWLFPGSKVIITTRCEWLLRAHGVCKVNWVEKLDYNESLELFSWHAFGKSHPIDGYLEESKRVVHHCGGLPLAIKVLGSSLRGKGLNIWKNELTKLKSIPNNKILEILKISYDNLQDDHDQNLFLHISCFFVGKDKDCTVTILDGCDFYTMVGIQNLIDRCLLTIDQCNKLVMHQLLQEVGREIVRQESPKEPGERSRLWNTYDSFKVLREKGGTGKIEGMVLDVNLLIKNESSNVVISVNRKRHYQEPVQKPLLRNAGNSHRRYNFGIFSWHSTDTELGSSNQPALEADAFECMHKLKFLKLGFIEINGGFKKFPKGIKWLNWHGFPLKSIPTDFPLETVVALEMHYSRLEKIWEGTKFFNLLKILDLSHSSELSKTPDFLLLPSLERLILEDCAKLYEVHESVGHLERLVLLNLKDCKNLRKLPRNIAMLKCLEILDISGCSNLEKLPAGLGNMESLTMLHANGTAINQLLSRTEEIIKSWHSFIWSSIQLKPSKIPVISWAILPQSLVTLSLRNCNLSEDDFPRDLSNLSSLQKLDLSNNPIRRLPDCVRGLSGLQMLYLKSCIRLRSLLGVQKLKEFSFVKCRSLEKITFMSPGSDPSFFEYGFCDSLVEYMGFFKLEPIKNVDPEIIESLGLTRLGSIESQNVKLLSRFTAKVRKLPPQGCHEKHIFCTYLPGGKVPAWFDLINIGPSVSFTVPYSHLNFKIRGMSLCSVYALCNSEFSDGHIWSHTIISNTTKSLVWSHSPMVFGIPEHDDDMLWLSYWKFHDNQLEGGDELNVSTFLGDGFQIKEVGVRLLFKEKQEETQSTPTKEEELCQQMSLYGNVVPGNVSAHPASTIFFPLSIHYVPCKDYCPCIAQFGLLS